MQRLAAKPKPKPVVPQIHIVPQTTWMTLPQRIAEGIAVAMAVSAVTGLTAGIFGVCRLSIFFLKGK